MPGIDELRILTQVDVAGIQSGMAESAAAVETHTNAMKANFEEVREVSEYSMTEARHAVHGLGEEIGIHVPRFVQGFIAHLGGVGPVLAAAFAPIAVIGLVEVLGELPEAIQKGIDKLAGFDDELKKTYSDAFKENVKLQSEALETAHKLGEIGLIGKEGPELARAKMKLLGDDEKRAAALATEITQSMSRLKSETEGLQPLAIHRGWDEIASLFNGNREKIKQNKEELQEYQQVLDGLVAKMKEMNAVEKPHGRAEIIEADAKAEDEAQKEAERQFHARTIAELNDAALLAKEKTVLLAEDAKRTAEFYKNIEAAEKTSDKEKERAEEEALHRTIEIYNREYSERKKKLEKEVQEENRAFNRITNDINKNLIMAINGQESFGRAAQKIWTSIADDAMTTILKIGEKWVAEHVIMAAMSKLFHVQDAAAWLAGVTAKIVAMKTLGMAQVSLAGSGGVASMAAAPFPIDTTAPAFGAAMSGAAASFLAFEEGGFVPGSGPVPAIVHGGERVLTKEQQRDFGGHTFNFNHHGSGSNDQVRSSSREFFKMAKREMRRMNR